MESERGFRERPTNPDAADILLRARALRSNLAPNPQRWTEVVSLYEHAAELEPSSVTALTGLANALIDTTYGKADDPTAAEKYRRADELVTRAELLHPDHVEVMCARVYLLGKLGRYTELIPIARRGIEIHPNRTSFSLWLGTCLTRTGRAEEAIPQLEREIRLSPRNAQIFARYELMGYALAFLGRYDEAIPWLQRAFAAHPNMDAWMRSGILATLAAAQALSNHPRGAGQRGQGMPYLASAHRARLLSDQYQGPCRHCTGRSIARGPATCGDSGSCGRGRQFRHRIR